MTRATPEVAAAVDPAFAWAVIGGVAATYVTVALFFYLPMIKAVATWFLRRTRRRIERSTQWLSIRPGGRVLWLADVLVVIGWRFCIALYAAALLLLVGPLLLALGSLELAASLIRF